MAGMGLQRRWLLPRLLARQRQEQVQLRSTRAVYRLRRHQHQQRRPDLDRWTPSKTVAHLLTRAYLLPCSMAAQAFAHLVRPVARFQPACDALLPLLDAGAVEDEKSEKNVRGIDVQLAEVRVPSVLVSSGCMRAICVPGS